MPSELEQLPPGSIPQIEGLPKSNWLNSAESLAKETSFAEQLQILRQSALGTGEEQERDKSPLAKSTVLPHVELELMPLPQQANHLADHQVVWPDSKFRPFSKTEPEYNIPCYNLIPEQNRYHKSQEIDPLWLTGSAFNIGIGTVWGGIFAAALAKPGTEGKSFGLGAGTGLGLTAGVAGVEYALDRMLFDNPPPGICSTLADNSHFALSLLPSSSWQGMLAKGAVMIGIHMAGRELDRTMGLYFYENGR